MPSVDANPDGQRITLITSEGEAVYVIPADRETLINIAERTAVAPFGFLHCGKRYLVPRDHLGLFVRLGRMLAKEVPENIPTEKLREHGF